MSVRYQKNCQIEGMVKMQLKLVKFALGIAPCAVVTVLIASAPAYAAQTGTNVVKPDAQTGTNTVKPLAQTGTNVIKPDAQTGTNMIKPLAQTGTNSVKPSAQTGTHAIIPRKDACELSLSLLAEKSC